MNGGLILEPSSVPRPLGYIWVIRFVLLGGWLFVLSAAALVWSQESPSALAVRALWSTGIVLQVAALVARLRHEGQ